MQCSLGTIGDSLSDWVNLSYANVATTSPIAHQTSTEWSDSLARGGAAEFDGEAEKNGMMPLRRATARLLSCKVEDVCVGSSATELLCSVAWATSPPKGSNIVSTRASFPSTVYPWIRVADANGALARSAVTRYRCSCCAHLNPSLPKGTFAPLHHSIPRRTHHG